MARRMTKTAIRRGAPRRGEPSARERLIEIAIELFYQEGIRAIGIDTVVTRSGVSKSSLYRTFASKDESRSRIDGFGSGGMRPYSAMLENHVGRSKCSLRAFPDRSRIHSSVAARSSISPLNFRIGNIPAWQLRAPTRRKSANAYAVWPAAHVIPVNSAINSRF